MFIRFMKDYLYECPKCERLMDYFYLKPCESSDKQEEAFAIINGVNYKVIECDECKLGMKVEDE